MKTTTYKKLFLLAALPALMLASCSKEEMTGEPGGSPDTQPGEIRFEIGFAPQDGAINATPGGATSDVPQTRVVTDSEFRSTWEAGDAIGIFACDADTDELVIENEKLIYTGSAWESRNILYWRGRRLKFYAYYPYDVNANAPTAIAFQAKSDQSGTTGTGALQRSDYSLSDLMTATDAGGKSAGETVSLAFEHRFAMIQVEVPSPVKDWDPVNPMTVHLRGVQTGAMLNLTGGSAPAAQATGGTGSVKMHLAGKPGKEGYSNYTYRAVVPVQTLKSGEDLFLISDKGTLYKGSGPDTDLELTAGEVAVFIRLLPAESGNN